MLQNTLLVYFFPSYLFVCNSHTQKYSHKLKSIIFSSSFIFLVSFCFQKREWKFRKFLWTFQFHFPRENDDGVIGLSILCNSHYYVILKNIWIFCEWREKDDENSFHGITFDFSCELLEFVWIFDKVFKSRNLKINIAKYKKYRHIIC